MPRWLEHMGQWMRAHPLGSMTLVGVLGVLLYWQLQPPVPSAVQRPLTQAGAFPGAIPDDATTAKALAQMQRQSETLQLTIQAQQRALEKLERTQRIQAESLQHQRTQQEEQVERALQDALRTVQNATTVPAPSAAVSPPTSTPFVVHAPQPPPRIRILRPKPQALSATPGPQRGSLAPTAVSTVQASVPDQRWVQLPAGSFVAGRLLTGLFASTRAGGAMPVLIVVGTAFSGPNHREIPLQGCLAIGKASADLASRRVLIQLTTMACVLPDGTSFERPIQGYVTGRDSTLGVPGRLETRSGAFLANIAAAAVVAGGEEFARTQSTGSGNVVTKIGGTALQRSTQRLVDFFLDRAEEIVPVIWVEANQPVSLVMQRGLTIEGLPAMAHLPTRPVGLD